MPGTHCAVLALAPTHTAQPPPPFLVASTAVTALLVVFAAWPAVRWILVVAHVGGSTLLASAFGAKIGSIRLVRAQGGRTEVTGLSDAGMFFALLAGYGGPPMFGVTAAVLLDSGFAVAVLWISVVLLALALIQVPLSNPFGVLVVLATGGTVFLAARYGTATVRTGFGCTWAWLLLFGGLRHVVDGRSAYRSIRAGREAAKKDKKDPGEVEPEFDLTRLHKVTRVPELLWVWFFLLAAFAALLYGGSILLGLTDPPHG